MRFVSLGLLLLFVTVVFSQPKGKPLPTFSKYESGSVRRMYSLSLGQEIQDYDFAVDTVKQRAYTKITSISKNRLIGEYWLIWLPSGAIPDSEETYGYVLFKVEDSNPDDADPTTYCSYLSTTKIHFGSGLNYPPEAFPDHWDRNYKIKIQNWIEIPSGMKFGGVVSESGNQYDTWVSEDLCYETDFGELPCNKISTRKDTIVPSSVFYSQDSGGSTFRTSWWYNDQYNHYAETVYEILPPKNWTTRCYNARNGFNMNPFGRGFVSTVAGTDNFTLSLSGTPVDELGPVTVSFMFDGETCTDCIAFEDEYHNPVDSVVFTSSNWKTSVLINIRYLKDGETYFFVVGSGGGYSIPSWHSFFNADGSASTMSHGHRVLTCAQGIPGYGCYKTHH